MIEASALAEHGLLSPDRIHQTLETGLERNSLGGKCLF
jgi:hypothetical protein